MGGKQVEIAVKDYLRILRNNKIAVEQAVLYGSQASDTADEDSDIDVVIISSDFGHDYVKEAVRLKMLTLDVNPDISPRPYSVDDYRKAKPGDFLYDEVISKGKVLS
ncbi:MAG TPA: nucleotidyltransferase domain-containing protein [Methylomusa anaerophila]|uniref:Nucleotidyltransferase domain protein n=1 Tax=Methylomusa anaerophila TaxID=1930071 RepID=A0A348AGM8_9FIRM|nr:nucleotidyltransferase domain-containing protein [Methylomusa anaerophila]BBB90226.1 nucleotidyltransferase domain protein [Methylomusa anaerophila]HML90741.1 nucleotidyltransferase domain-containing protein [Methylomusa anaerophila]